MTDVVTNRVVSRDELLITVGRVMPPALQLTPSMSLRPTARVRPYSHQPKITKVTVQQPPLSRADARMYREEFNRDEANEAYYTPQTISGVTQPGQEIIIDDRDLSGAVDNSQDVDFWPEGVIPFDHRGRPLDVPTATEIPPLSPRVTEVPASPTANDSDVPETTLTTPPTMSLSSTGRISIELSENSTFINIALGQEDLVEEYRNLTDVFSHDSFQLRIRGTGADQDSTEEVTEPDEEEVTSPITGPATPLHSPRTPSQSPPPDDDDADNTDDNFHYRMPDTRPKSL